jgi:uncharacterized protein DUF6527
VTGPSIAQADWERMYPDGELQLGGGERLRFTSDGRGHVLGAIHDHPRRRPPDHPDLHWQSDDFSCSGMIWFDVPELANYDNDKDHPRARWQIVQDHPLTLSPSVRCSTCGDHGFVRSGQWEPAA